MRWRSGAGAGGDRRRAHRRHRREGGDAVGPVVAALHQRLHRGRLARRDRPLEHRRLHRVDDREDELRGPAHRRMRRPAYFSPSRRLAAERAGRRGRRRRRARAAGRARTGRPRRARRPRGRAAAGRGLGVEAACGRARSSGRDGDERERGAAHAGDDARRRPGGRGRPASRRPASAAIATATRPRATSPGAASSALVARAAAQRGRSATRPTSIASRNGGSSRNAKSVPSKSTPRSPAASAPTSSAGRKGRMPTAAPMPAACRMSRTVSMDTRSRRVTLEDEGRRPKSARPDRTQHELERYAGPVRLAHAGHEVLGDARPDGDHRAARGHLAGRRAARHDHVPARARSPRSCRRIAAERLRAGAPVRADRGHRRGQGLHRRGDGRRGHARRRRRHRSSPPAASRSSTSSARR